MNFPQQTIPTVPELRNYINQFIIPNGAEEINGTEHNNVENALLNFIVQSTINYSKAQIVNGGATVTLTKGVTIFSAAPAFLYWADNFYNEYLIVNRSPDVIPLNPGLTYVDQYGDVQTEIAAGAVVHLTQMTNGMWAQANNIGGGGTDIPNTPDSSAAIEVTTTGGFGRVIGAELKLSATAGNAVQVLPDGVYVPPAAADVPNQGVETDSIIIDTGGTLDRVLSADLKVSAVANNAAQILSDGLFVDNSDGGTTNSYYGNIDS